MIWFFVIAGLVVTGLGRLPAAGHQTPLSESSGNTWSLVAVDEATGQVGVAGASCFPQAIDAIAALVPGHGAAATQAAFSLENRDAAFALLQQGQSAEDIVEALAQGTADREAAQRQYGVVTMGDGEANVAGYTGSANESWAGDRQAPAAAVAVQGNLLEGEAVVADALQAFEAALQEGLPLSDRLMDGLEAGAAAGGDRRCNRNGVRQTASTAFIMVARAEQAPFAVVELGSTEVDSPEAPWLYLSVSLPVGGENAVTALRAQYQQHMAGEADGGASEAADGRPPATGSGTEGTGNVGWAPIVVIAVVALSLPALGAIIWFWGRGRT